MFVDRLFDRWKDIDRKRQYEQHQKPDRDAYELTVTATDEGTPPKTGYTKVIVKIIDINDNQPQFPQPAPISVSEGKIVLHYCFETD